MTLLVSDVNVLLDFEVAGLLRKVRALREIAIPDILYAEELDGIFPGITKLNWRIIELQVPAVRRLVALAALYSKPSRSDLSALALAEQEECPLITGDTELRAAAEREGLTVYGTLWLAARLVEEGIASVVELGDGYQRMKDSDRRLPWGEVTLQLRRLHCPTSKLPR